MKGQMLGSRSLEDDISLAHSVYASSLQSEVSARACNRAALAAPQNAQPADAICAGCGYRLCPN